MPSVKMCIDLGQGVRLPAEHRHIVQGLIYSLMADDPALSSAVHDGGVRFEGHSYKLFTFSELRGLSKAVGDGMLYTGPCELEFRSPDMDLCQAVSGAISRRGAVRLGAVEAPVVGMVLSQRSFFSEAISVRMEAPVTVHRRLPDGHTRYYQPSEPEFAQLIADNFARKYIACYGEPPEEGVLLTPRLVGPEDRIVTHFKGTVVKGCLGHYLLRGRPEYINFLYDCGLGDRNSQGFGMFEVE